MGTLCIVIAVQISLGSSSDSFDPTGKYTPFDPWLVRRLDGTIGPQFVTIGGKEEAVILPPEEYEHLIPKP